MNYGFKDITYVRCLYGFCYTAFITDVFSNMIVGWMVSDKIDTKLVLDALDMAISQRHKPGNKLIHHSDKGSQYFSNEYVNRLEKELIVQSAGTTGDSFDNALSESVNSFYKTELIRNEYLNYEFKDKADLEAKTASYVHWWNKRRIQVRLDDMSPVQYEKQYNELNRTPKVA